MMDKQSNFEKAAQQIRKLTVFLFVSFFALAIILIYVLIDPTLSVFQSTPETEIITLEEDNEKDFDKIENGIHIRTGFVEGKGLMTVINNCTNCHSAKLVTQNRMTAAGWEATIDWMQETQNLWDLGDNEKIIVDYLATHYAPERKGRRENLTNVEWYELE